MEMHLQLPTSIQSKEVIAMQKYRNPEMGIAKFDTESILTASSGGADPTPTPVVINPDAAGDGVWGRSLSDV